MTSTLPRVPPMVSDRAPPVRSRSDWNTSGRSFPDDPGEPVFRCPFQQPDKFFPRPIERAQQTLRDAKKDAARLDGYTWRCNRHTFASWLAVAGVDLRSVQAFGGWRTRAMVQRYSHLASDHLRAAVERLVPPSAPLNSTRIQPTTQEERAWCIVSPHAPVAQSDRASAF